MTGSDVTHPLGLSRNGLPIIGRLATAHAGEFIELERGLKLLHPSELDRLADLHYPRRRMSYLLGRVAAKRALVAGWPEIVPSSIAIESGVFGQPILRGVAPEIPEISLSHSGDTAVAVAALVGHLIGVDLEQIDSRQSVFLSGQLAPGEVDQTREAGLDPDLACWHVWTIKEALSKVLRCGMTTPWSIFELGRLEHDGRGEVEASFRNFGQYRAKSWVIGAHVLSIVLPSRTAIQFDPRGLRLLS